MSRDHMHRARTSEICLLDLECTAPCRVYSVPGAPPCVPTARKKIQSSSARARYSLAASPWAPAVRRAPPRCSPPVRSAKGQVGRVDSEPTILGRMTCRPMPVQPVELSLPRFGNERSLFWRAPSRSLTRFQLAFKYQFDLSFACQAIFHGDFDQTRIFKTKNMRKVNGKRIEQHS